MPAVLATPPGLECHDGFEAPPGLEGLSTTAKKPCLPAEGLQTVLGLLTRELGARASFLGTLHDNLCPAIVGCPTDTMNEQSRLPYFNNCKHLDAYDSRGLRPKTALDDFTFPNRLGKSAPTAQQLSDWKKSQQEPKKVNINWSFEDPAHTFPVTKLQPPGSPMSTTCTARDSEAESLGNDFDHVHLCEEPSKWHESASLVGMISADGHVFTKMAGAERVRTTDAGILQKLSSICMIMDHRLHCGGLHRYTYQILGGEVGPADGAGFAFDCKVRRNNMQRMRSIFLNNRGQICFRNQQVVQKVNMTLPRMDVGAWLTLTVDLDNLYFHFEISNSDGSECGSADFFLASILGDVWQDDTWRKWNSGFFCAIVTKDISVYLE
jgi:hypothetical protein